MNYASYFEHFQICVQCLYYSIYIVMSYKRKLISTVYDFFSYLSLVNTFYELSVFKFCVSLFIYEAFSRFHFHFRILFIIGILLLVLEKAQVQPLSNSFSNFSRSEMTQFWSVNYICQVFSHRCFLLNFEEK